MTEFDGLRLNLSKQEASADVRELLPAGWYRVVISDVELKQSTSAKNPGKPYYAITYTIAEGEKYEGRKLYDNVMLFEGALYSAVKIAKAMGFFDEENFVFPEGDWLLGKELQVRVKKQGERTVVDKESGEKKTYDERNEVTDYKSPTAESPATAATGSSSLLPS